jgi:site-specific recombinase XerD
MVEFEDNNKINSFSISWQVMLSEYEQALKAAGKSPKTIDGYISNNRKFFIFLEVANGTKPIESIGKKELREYIEHLQSRTRWPDNPYIREENRGALSPFTRLAYVRDIKTLWSWMYREGYVEENKLAHFQLPSVPENLPKIITPAQFATLLSHIDRSTPEGSKYHCILLILYDNGMRISELVKIRICDIDFQGKTIIVMGKGQRERPVPITVYTRKQILRYIDQVRTRICPKDSPYLFVNCDGEPFSISSVQQFMRRLLEKSGLEVKFSPHVLRHSFATQYLANGGNVFYLKAILGHKSLITTLGYTRTLPKDIQDQHMKYSPVAELFRNRS